MGEGRLRGAIQGRLEGLMLRLAASRPSAHDGRASASRCTFEVQTECGAARLPGAALPGLAA